MRVAQITETTQYLTFKLAEEAFALDVARVREILEYTSFTKVPQIPDFLRGVINLQQGDWKKDCNLAAILDMDRVFFNEDLMAIREETTCNI